MHPQRSQFGYYFAVLHRLGVAKSKQGIMDLGIQISQMPFIAELLRYDKPVTQDTLCSALAIDKAATARALEQLEKNGFVTRIVNPQNRRQNLVTVTKKAISIKTRFFDILQQTSDILVQDFSEQEKNQLLQLLNKLIANALKTNI